MIARPSDPKIEFMYRPHRAKPLIARLRYQRYHRGAYGRIR